MSGQRCPDDGLGRDAHSHFQFAHATFGTEDFQLSNRGGLRQFGFLMHPFTALSQFIYLCVLVTGPVAWMLWLIFKRRWGRAYDGVIESSSEEILDELAREFTPTHRTVIRTQTEYLPFLFESIRENIDSGFGDSQMISLLERIQIHRPDQERGAMFTVVSGQRRSDLHLRWTRDSCDRIQLRIQGEPRIIRALRDHKCRIPKSVAGLA